MHLEVYHIVTLFFGGGEKAGFLVNPLKFEIQPLFKRVKSWTYKFFAGLYL